MMAETSGGGSKIYGVEAWTGIAEAAMAGLGDAGWGWAALADEGVELGDGEVGGAGSGAGAPSARRFSRAIAWLGSTSRT